ncbi:MAG: hypothetical protein VX659_10255, partial [Pseudomonadota bacterium]|nr:hypothetical protein [Pseudomonadota bacterium]
MGKGKKSVGFAVMLALATMVGMSCSGVVAEAPVDFTGTYDVATLTPLERPKMFGNKEFLTREEAARISRDDAALKAARNNNSDPNRGAPPAGGDGSSGAAGNVGGYNTFWIDNGNAAFEL